MTAGPVAPPGAPRSPYIVGRAYDWAFFLLPPLLSLLLGIAIAHTPLTERTLRLADHEVTPARLGVGIIIHAHLCAVLLRSHGNASVRRRHPVRFFAVPVVLWMLIAGSAKLAVAATLVATFWDVWHSGAQTFGLARIYDRNAGNPPEAGRRLDLWLNQLLYAGPILAGATLVDHVAPFADFESVGVTLFSTVPARAAGLQHLLAWAVLLGGCVLLAAYGVLQVRLWRRGYRVSRLKVFLVVTTGACSLYSWGFNTFGEAFFTMNLFHAVQYLALVWHAEQKTWMARLRLRGQRGAAVLGCASYLIAVLAYGFVAQLFDSRQQALWAVTLVVSLLHFWYDGFVWSVRRGEV